MSRSNGICIDCGEEAYAKRLRCYGCWMARWYYMDFLRGASEAQAAVSYAIGTGALLPPTSFRCVDCGGPASQYDHRDYGRPLDVIPVCRRDNLRRGPAIPKRLTPEDVVARISSLALHHRWTSRANIAAKLSRWPALSRHLPGVEPRHLSVLLEEAAA